MHFVVAIINQVCCFVAKSATSVSWSPASVSYKSVPQYCATRCAARVSSKSAAQRCPARLCDKSVLLRALLI